MSEKQRGFTLVEVMVAITIILIALIPIFGSMYGVLYYHREILDREVALGLMRSLENVLDSQKQFYTYDSDGNPVVIWNMSDSDRKEYPIILSKSSADSWSDKDYEIKTVINGKSFIIRAYAMRNPAVCIGIPDSSSCSSYESIKGLYAVRLVVSWQEQEKYKNIEFVRRFYKP